MRRTLPQVATIVAAVLVALLGVVGQAVGAEPPVPVRVMTFNIHAGHGNLQRVADAIEAQQPDVVGLQEVDVHWGTRSGFADQARELADDLDMRVFFAPIYQLAPLEAGAPPREYGLAILSRHPIVEATNHQLTRLSTQDSDPAPAPAPGFPETVVEIRGARLHFYDTHLDYRADPTVRRLQVDDTLAILDADPPGASTVLVGDLNAEPHAPELAPLYERLRDAWAVVGVGDGATFPATGPTKRIDAVLVSAGITVTAAAAVDTGASDHRAVVADLLVPRGRPFSAPAP